MPPPRQTGSRRNMFYLSVCPLAHLAWKGMDRFHCRWELTTWADWKSATGFRPLSATVVFAEPFSHGTGTLRCLQKEMATYRHWSVSLWWDLDDVSHCRILSPDKTDWQLISATLCRWRRCFVADQLWLMKRIREEDCKLVQVVHGARAWNSRHWGSGGQGQGHRRPKWVTRSVSVRYLKNCPTYQTWQAHITINAIASWRPRCKSSTRSRSCEAKLPLQSFVPPTPQCQLAFLVLYDAADWFVCTSAVCCLERLWHDLSKW